MKVQSPPSPPDMIDDPWTPVPATPPDFKKWRALLAVEEREWQEAIAGARLRAATAPATVVPRQDAAPPPPPEEDWQALIARAKAPAEQPPPARRLRAPVERVWRALFGRPRPVSAELR
jgi:hypothetical protein